MEKHDLKFSPLFWPVTLKNNTIYILDETRLPEKMVYLKATTYQQAALAIKQMKTRALGQVILVFYVFLMLSRANKAKKNMLELFAKAASALNSTRPTLPFRFLTDMILGWARSGAPLEKNIMGFLEMLKHKRIAQAKTAALLLEDKDVILTHCHVSGSMPLIAELCRKDGKEVSFYATETRPYLQGARLTAWELHRQSIPVTVIADSMVAQVMSEGRISKVMVGADHLARNGDIANKIGTYQIALLAQHFHIPFYVLCPPVSGSETGKDIPIEIRPDNELLEFRGIRTAPRGVKGYYPGFDITPANLITKHIHLEMS
jgi:methylthioribose-1-phosphate isomerase